MRNSNAENHAGAERKFKRRVSEYRIYPTYTETELCWQLLGSEASHDHVILRVRRGVTSRSHWWHNDSQ